MIYNKIQGYIVKNGASYCLYHVSSLLCETACSNKQPEDSDVIKHK